jgi:hypothetical protein
MTDPTAPRLFPRTWLPWSAAFIAFPFAGLAGTAAAGRATKPAPPWSAGR